MSTKSKAAGLPADGCCRTNAPVGRYQDQSLPERTHLAAGGGDAGLRTDSFIPLSVPDMQGNEWQYVRECLETNWVSSAGAYVERFEQQVAQQAGTRHAVATCSGTAALHTALLVAGVEPGDEVLVSTLTFIASANAVRYVGAHPVFVDAEPRHWQMDPALVEEFLTRQCEWRDGALVNRATGRRVRAIMPVHVLGHPVDMDPILELARRWELKVIEDAAESLGVRYDDRPVGSLGDVACFSFNGNKLITTGGGGMLVTNDTHLAERARYLTTQAKDDPLEYVHGEVGYNYRMPNLLAAVGCGQLEKLPDYTTIKRRIAERYRCALANVPGVDCFTASPKVYCTFWLSTVLIDAARFTIDRRELCHRLRQQRIETRPLWQPMHRSPAYRGAQAVVSGVADRLVAEALSLPSSVSLSAADQDRVCRAIAELAAETQQRKRSA